MIIMPSSGSSSLRRPVSPVRSVSYDAVKPGKAPIPIQVAPKPSQARLESHPALRPSTPPDPQHTLRSQRSYLRDQDDRRDSGVGTASSTKRQSRATTIGTDRTDAESTKSGKARSVTHKSSLPRMDHKSEATSQMSSSKTQVANGTPPDAKEKETQSSNDAPRIPDSIILNDIPSFSLEDLSSPNGIQFSKRGSLLVRGKRPSTSPSHTPRSASPALPSIPQLDRSPETAAAAPTVVADPELRDMRRMPTIPKRTSLLDIPKTPPSAASKPVPRPRRSMQNVISRLSSIQTRPLTSEEETLSQRIRSMYENGVETPGFWRSAEDLSMPDVRRMDLADSDDNAQISPVKTINSQYSRTSVVNPALPRVLEREENEVAGGIEDWEGVKSDQVDRYGFITKPPEVSVTSPDTSHASQSASGAAAPEGHGLARMATQLKVASETPRRSRSFRSRIGAARRLSASGSARSLDPNIGRVSSGDRRSYVRPSSSQASYRSTQSSATSRLRRAANHLPQNRGRKVIDEAGDMLTLPPGLAEVAEAEALKGTSASKALEARSARERTREEKWRKMAKVLKPERPGTGKSTKKTKEQAVESPDGGGMHFWFDTSNAKLIARTWKGIPDRWRATAWWSFLSTSAKKNKDSLSDQELTKIFYELISQPSPDDVQIDLDVPRTIGGHVMFRKRYRGGQRLLFRVLHALSLYFPDPGYVQGMAALAATFLCYFQEELAFVMLVRMWELRGLAKLYKAGFEGLMTALGEFEHQWLEGGTVGAKLKELGITPTAYGTRWYLTVFNYSIPFSAQLRVWDVFLLLGDEDPNLPAAPKISGDKTTGAIAGEPTIAFNGSLDVLHSTSAALIDATREILLDSDFENGMKTLTSWIPIRDEDLLMQVAKVEYKLHKQQQRKAR